MIITREQFKDIITLYQTFNSEIDKIGETIFGDSCTISLYESKFAEAANIMFDKFINVIFTEEGGDLIYWWIYEDVDKVIYDKIPDNLFEKGRDIEYSVKTLDELYNYMIKNKEIYFNE